MRTLGEAVFTESYNYLEVKFETWALQLIPKETTREQLSFVEGFTEGHSEQFGRAFATALAHGLALSESESYGETDADSESHSHARNKTRSTNWQQAHHSGVGGADHWSFDADLNLIGMGAGANWSLADVMGEGGAEAEGTSDSDTYGHSRSVSRMFSRGLARSVMEAISNTTSEQFGQNWGKTVQEARTIVPFYEYEQEERVSSRQYVSYEEHILRNMVKALSLRRGWFGLKPPYTHVRYFLTAWPEPLHPPSLGLSVEIMIGHPSYPLDPRNPVSTPPEPEQALIPEVLPPIDGEASEDDTEPTNDDFAQHWPVPAV